MADINHAIKIFAEMADDFFFDVLLLKSKDISNGSIPFVHAHTLELSAKAACYKLGIDIKNCGHNIMSIYKLLENPIPQISSLIPTLQELDDYKKLWIPSDVVQIASLPAPNNMQRLELAYFVDNVMNLKYGFTKELVQVSSVEISYQAINEDFLKLFQICRQVYSNGELNDRIKQKIFGVFGDRAETKEKIKSFLNI